MLVYLEENTYNSSNMQTLAQEPLAPYTSLKCGGAAETLHLPLHREQVIELLAQTSPNDPVWLLGFGSNCLISDAGLPGTTILWRGGDISQDGETVIVDAGVWWEWIVAWVSRGHREREVGGDAAGPDPEGGGGRTRGDRDRVLGAGQGEGEDPRWGV